MHRMSQSVAAQPFVAALEENHPFQVKRPFSTPPKSVVRLFPTGGAFYSNAPRPRTLDGTAAPENIYPPATRGTAHASFRGKMARHSHIRQRRVNAVRTSWIVPVGEEAPSVEPARVVHLLESRSYDDLLKLLREAALRAPMDLPLHRSVKLLENYLAGKPLPRDKQTA